MIRRLVFPGLLGLAGYYALFGGEYTALDLHEIRLEMDRSELSVVELRQATASLGTRAEALEQDPRTLEALARENFGMIRDGEILYRFAESGAPAIEEEETP